jgi:hypothetical protein
MWLFLNFVKFLQFFSFIYFFPKKMEGILGIDTYVLEFNRKFKRGEIEKN